MTKARQLSKQQKLQKCQDAIDGKFADIQRYILNMKFLDERIKGNMLTLCMICNDSIISALESEHV